MNDRPVDEFELFERGAFDAFANEESFDELWSVIAIESAETNEPPPLGFGEEESLATPTCV